MHRAERQNGPNPSSTEHQRCAPLIACRPGQHPPGPGRPGRSGDLAYELGTGGT